MPKTKLLSKSTLKKYYKRLKLGLKSRSSLIIFVVLFALIGSTLLIASHAANPTASIEPENGTINSPATSCGTTSGASNSGCVQFNKIGVSNIPASIKNDCSTDVTTDINSWLATVPNNSTVNFGTNACYQINGIITISGRHGLTIDGHGASFKAFTDGTELGATKARVRDQFLINGASSNITIKNTIVYGANQNGGIGDAAYVAALEAQHAYEIGSGSNHILLDNVQAYNVYGDFVYIGNGGGASYVTVQNSTFARNGRQGISVTWGSNILIQHNSLTDVRRTDFDIEPTGDTWAIQHVTIQNNTIGLTRLNLLSGDGACAIMNDINFINNQVNRDFGVSIDRPAADGKNPDGTSKPCLNTRTNINITGNIATGLSGNPSHGALGFTKIDGLTIANNTVPMEQFRQMNIIIARNSTSVRLTGNTALNAVGSINTDDGSTTDYCYSNNQIGNPLVLEVSTKPCS